MKTIIITNPTNNPLILPDQNNLWREKEINTLEMPKLSLCSIIVLNIDDRKEYVGAFFLKSESYISSEAIYSNLGELDSDSSDYFNSLVSTVKSEKFIPKRISESILNDFVRNSRMLELLESNENVELTVILPNMSVNYKSNEVTDLLNELY